MAAALPPDPGGKKQGQGSYAERLKTNVKFDQRLQRNVLEITLEKTVKEVEIFLNSECVARVVKSVGMDLEHEVEGYQQIFSLG